MIGPTSSASTAVLRARTTAAVGRPQNCHTPYVCSSHDVDRPADPPSGVSGGDRPELGGGSAGGPAVGVAHGRGAGRPAAAEAAAAVPGRRGGGGADPGAGRSAARVGRPVPGASRCPPAG